MTMQSSSDYLRPIISAALLACVVGAAAANDPGAMTNPVEHMATDAAPARTIAGSNAVLMTTPKGATMTLSTSELVPGNVTTAWWVIMTKPELCEAKPCSPKDVIGRADIVGTQIVYADGVVNAPDGSARFAAYLPAGAVRDGWFDQAFSNPTSAEIHLVLNDHGPLMPGIAASMLTSYRGGCRDDSLPPPFPATAKADGIPGPNACMLIQDSIFMQDGPAHSN